MARRRRVGIVVVVLTLAWASGASAKVAALSYVASGPGGVPKVWLAHADGADGRVLGTGQSGFLSPDGRLVAATPWGFGGPGVTLLSATGAVKGAFFRASAQTAVPVAWSVDSRYLAVTVIDGSVGGRPGLFVIDTRRGRVTRVASGGIAGASFAPDRSDRVVYGRSASAIFKGPLNIFVATHDGRSVRQVTHDGFSDDPVWGARGIAFDHAGGPHPGSATSQVWLMQPNGARRRPLTPLSRRRRVSGWAPLQFSANGRRLLAEYIAGPTEAQTWTIDIATHRVRHLKVHGRDVTPAALSQDGSTVLVQSENPEAVDATIETLPSTGGPARVLAHDSAPTWNR